jgi:membrane protease YdiL (CAAX protease family)
VPIGLGVTSLFIFGAAGLAFPAAFGQRPLVFTGLARNPGRLGALAVLIGIANLPFANFLMGAAKEVLPASWSDMADGTLEMLVKADTSTRVLLVVITSLAAPVGEELFFRGWMHGLLSRRFQKATSAIVVAILFSTVHFDPIGFVARVELGIVFALAYIWTGSLWGAIAVHAIHNLASTIGLYLSDDPLAEANAPFDWTTSAIAGVISLLLTVGLLALLRRLSMKRPVESVVIEPLQFTPGPGLRIALPSLLALCVSGVVLFVLRNRLPGGELTREILNKFLRELSKGSQATTKSR